MLSLQGPPGKTLDCGVPKSSKFGLTPTCVAAKRAAAAVFAVSVRISPENLGKIAKNRRKRVTLSRFRKWRTIVVVFVLLHAPVPEAFVYAPVTSATDQQPRDAQKFYAIRLYEHENLKPIRHNRKTDSFYTFQCVGQSKMQDKLRK